MSLSHLESMDLHSIAESQERIAEAVERIAAVLDDQVKVGGALEAIARLPRALSRLS